MELLRRWTGLLSSVLSCLNRDFRDNELDQRPVSLADAPHPGVVVHH